MAGLLDFSEQAELDDEIESYTVIAHLPYVTNFDYNNEIRILLNQADNLTDTGSSWLRIEGKINKGTGSVAPSLISNGILHLFDSITYKINQTEVDTVKSPGIAATLKALVSKSPNDLPLLENTGFSDPNGASNDKAPNCLFGNADSSGSVPFTAIIKLRDVLGFAEHLNNVLVNTAQELILTRAPSDFNALIGTSDDKTSSVTLTRVSWHVPQLKLSDLAKTQLYKRLLRDPTFVIPFRTWNLIENPALGSTNEINWNLKVTSQSARPRYVIVAFYVDQKNKIDKNLSLPASVPLKSARLYLNDEVFPYQENFLDIDKKITEELYNSYAEFQTSYYNGKSPSPLMKRSTLTSHPLCVIDCSRVKENIKSSSSVDVRLVLKFSSNLPDNTSCVTLLLSEAVLSYQPVSGTTYRS